MISLQMRYLLPLFILPVAAMADPVEVTSRSSGFMEPNPVALYRFGMDIPSTSAGKLPYQLTITSKFDSDDAMFGRGWEASIYGSEVAITFSLGTATYHYAGTGSTSMAVYLDEYTSDSEHGISFVPPESPGDTISVWNRLDVVAGLDLWAPHEVHLAPGGNGTTQFLSLPNDPDVPGYLNIVTPADAVSLQVVSAVPEPGSAGMLATGMLTLGLWRRYRRRAGLAAGSAQLHCIKQGGTSSSKASTR